MVSIYENCLTPKVYGNVSTDEAFDFIRRNKNAKKVRELYQNDRYAKEKIKLPGWTPAGQFKPTRSIDNLEQPSGYVYFDLDKFTDKQKVAEIPEVKAVWYSLSGNGLGGLFKSDVTKNNYSSTYDSFAEKYKLPVDKTSDISRFNILSFDSDIIVKDNPTIFPTVEPLRSKLVHYDFIDNPKYESSRMAYDITVKRGNLYKIGNRAKFCSCYFTMTNKLGVDIITATSYLKERKMKDNIDDGEDNSVYERALDIYSRYSNQYNIYKNESLLHEIVSKK